MEGAALSLYFLPSGVSTSALMFLTHSGLSIWLSTFTWTAAMVVPSVSADTTLVMASAALGGVRFVSTINATTIATSTAATTSGTIGGRVHLALSSSSVIGICPASAWVCRAAPTGGGLPDGGLGLALSAISRSGNKHTLLRC